MDVNLKCWLEKHLNEGHKECNRELSVFLGSYMEENNFILKSTEQR